jgi:uncharacterized membrane protein YfcA
VPAFVHLGLFNRDILLLDLKLVPVVLVGTFLGVYLNRRVPATWFTRVVLVIVLCTGLKLLLD